VFLTLSAAKAVYHGILNADTLAELVDITIEKMKVKIRCW